MSRLISTPSLGARVSAAIFAASILSITTMSVRADPVGPDAGLALHHLHVAEAALGDARIREREYGLRLWSPELAFDRLDFRFGADYVYTRYEYDGLSTRDRDLHRLRLPLQWRAHDDSWRLVLSPVIAASSNVFKDLFERGSGDDFDLHGRWQYQRWATPARGWRVALVRDDAFGEPRLYPAVALLLRGERIGAELGWPVTRLDWRAVERLTLGFAIAPAGVRWHVVSDERGGAEFDYRARAWRGALTAAWSPRTWMRLSAQAGIEFDRRYDFEDDTGARIDRDAASAAYCRFELGLDF